MNTQQVIEHRLHDIIKRLKKKQTEYASSDDPFHNFYKASVILQMSPQQVAWIYATKHFVSIQDMVDGILKPTEQLIDEKFGDVIAYLMLISAMNYDYDEVSDPERMELIIAQIQETDGVSKTVWEVVEGRKKTPASQLYDNIIYGQLTTGFTHVHDKNILQLLSDFIHLEILLRQSTKTKK